MKALWLLMIAAGASALGGCNRDGSGDGAAPTTPMPPTLPGVYAGRLPCSNCAAIVATLWLRPDGTFFLRQIFSDEDDRADTATSATYGLGRWHWDEQAAEAVLRSAGPERRLLVRDGDRLDLRVASPLEHVFERDPAAPLFQDRVRLDGESVVTKDGATFTECLTGLQLPVAATGEYRELRRQHRVLNPRGKVALTTIEGYFEAVTTDDATRETLVVDRVVTIKPGTACRGS